MRTAASRKRGSGKDSRRSFSGRIVVNTRPVDARRPSNRSKPTNFFGLSTNTVCQTSVQYSSHRPVAQRGLRTFEAPSQLKKSSHPSADSGRWGDPMTFSYHHWLGTVLAIKAWNRIGSIFLAMLPKVELALQRNHTIRSRKFPVPGGNCSAAKHYFP